MENKNFKCKSCGANIKMEEKSCSYCGCQNENFIEQKRDLQQQENKIQEMIERAFNGLPPFISSDWFSINKTNDEN